jgi:hypothetical protein
VVCYSKPPPAGNSHNRLSPTIKEVKMQFTTLPIKSTIKSNTCQYCGRGSLLVKFSHHFQSLFINILIYLKKKTLKINSLLFSKSVSRVRALSALLKMETLGHSVAIVIPTKDNRGMIIDPQPIISELSEIFCRLYGGFSIFPGIGGWINQDGLIIKENISRIEIFVSEEKLGECVQNIIHISFGLKIKYRQEKIAIIVDGVLYLI